MESVDTDKLKVQIVKELRTLAALEKQQLIQNKFLTWIWQDEERRWEVETEYNRMFASFEKKTYDGSKLTFPIRW